MKVKIMQRRVYHKYAEIEIEVPNEIEGYIMQQEDIRDYLIENEDLWIMDMDKEQGNAEFEFGNGVDNYSGMNEEESESEWRYSCPDGYGGHL